MMPSIIRRGSTSFSLLASLVLLCLPSLFCLDRPPNILFLLADDLGFADFDWRDPALQTPNLRRLAFSPHSALLSHLYVGPLCSPTRGAILSGLYPFRTGTQDGVFLHADSGGLPTTGVPLLPELLRRKFDYRTHLIGKWHLGYCRPELLPTRRGFDSFYGFYGPQEGYWNHSVDMVDHKRGDIMLSGLDLFRESQGRSKPDWTTQGRHSTELFTEEALRVMAHGDGAAPFFLLLSFQAVHAPLEADPRWVALCPGHLPLQRRLYCGLLAGMDHAIGRLVARLRALGEYERTLIVFGTDNGGDPEFGASNWPLRGGKGQLWEGGTRSTGIVHWVGHVRGGTRADLWHAVDWPATLLAAAGQQLDRFGDGLNQWPALTNGRPSPRAEVLYAATQTKTSRGEAAIRDLRFKLLLQPAPAPAVQLFDLLADPTEDRDLAAQMPDEVRRLRRRLAQLSGGPRHGSAFRGRTDPRGWPQRNGGAFLGGWC